MTVSRRDFLSAATATAALGLMTSRPAFAAETSDLRVAVIGVNGRGRSHLGAFRNNLVAVCDVDAKVLDARCNELKEKHNVDVERFTDFRKLLERKDIDAVSVATPNHIHALIAVSAAQAGKHVYLEKPISHDIWEGRQIVEASRKYNSIMQCGTQSRSSKSLQDAVAFVQSGKLGKIEYALGTCYKPRPSIGKLDAPLQIPDSIDYDLWCGPAEKRDLFRPHLHYDWHWDFNTGNGDMGNQGIHQMDIARWFLGEQTLAPRTISIGSRSGYDDAGDTPNTQVVYHDYDAAPLIFETRGLPTSKAGQARWGRNMDKFRGAGIAVIIQCENGHVLVPSYTDAIAYDLQGKKVEEWHGGGDHFGNWLSAVAAGDPSRLSGKIHEGHISSSLCHTGGVSHQLGKEMRYGDIAEQVAHNERLSISLDRMAAHLRANDVDVDREKTLTLGPWLQLDTETEMFIGNDAANALRSREHQREPFAVADVERDSRMSSVAS